MKASPIPPKVEGEVADSTNGFAALPNSLINSWSAVWIWLIGQRPLNSTIWRALLIPSSRLSVSNSDDVDNFHESTVLFITSLHILLQGWWFPSGTETNVQRSMLLVSNDVRIQFHPAQFLLLAFTPKQNSSRRAFLFVNKSKCGRFEFFHRRFLYRWPLVQDAQTIPLSNDLEHDDIVCCLADGWFLAGTFPASQELVSTRIKLAFTVTLPPVAGSCNSFTWRFIKGIVCFHRRLRVISCTTVLRCSSAIAASRRFVPHEQMILESERLAGAMGLNVLQKNQAFKL